jgi:polyhydroxyalkanoate synthesis regulator phasin
MPSQPSDFLQPDFLKPDFLKPELLKNYQSFAQQSWEAWSKQWQQPGAAAPWLQSAPAKAPMDDALERTLGSFKSYLDWLQRAATSGVAQAPAGGDWWQPLQQLFGAGSQPGVPPFASFDKAFAGNFGQPWQSWMQASQQVGQPGGMAGMEALRGMLQTPAFGYSREQQEQQQALALAMLEHQQAGQRYQALMLRAQLQGAERLQQKLSERTEPGKQVESLKALYDLWVDSAEEAYAEIALSDEFREVYANQVNTQMRVKQLQFQQIEQWCREIGLPTRSEVASLGQRLQELRREVRQNRAAPRAHGEPAGVAELQAEIEVLREQLQASRARASTRKQTAAPSSAKPAPTVADKAAATGRAPRNATTPASSKSEPRTAATPRKRR